MLRGTLTAHAQSAPAKKPAIIHFCMTWQIYPSTNERALAALIDLVGSL